MHPVPSNRNQPFCSSPCKEAPKSIRESQVTKESDLSNGPRLTGPLRSHRDQRPLRSKQTRSKHPGHTLILSSNNHQLTHSCGGQLHTDGGSGGRQPALSPRPCLRSPTLRSGRPTFRAVGLSFQTFHTAFGTLEMLPLALWEIAKKLSAVF